EGLKTKYSKELPKNVIDRAEYELQVINSMGYNGYFIIVWDFIRYAKENGIYVGPGRGSAAGSIVSYALNITEIDPLKYNLIFERFLNPERISMPDIDIDFDQEQREQVIEYVLEKYGVERVAHIITFGTLKARAAIRDVGRVLNVNIKKVDMVAKLIPFMMELEAALSSVDRLQELYKTDHEIKQLIDYSLKLEGRVRHASVHAAGIVISKEVLNEEIPTYSDGKTKILSTQYQMKELEDLGILKMDFLGLKNLTILRKTIENIKKTRNEDIILSNINLDDKNAYDLLTTADTLGIFQCESAGIRNLMKRVKIEKFEDIVAVLALYRPGPLRSGMVEDFIQSKNNKVAIKYMHESLQDVLEETYGVILYQEQVMKIVNIMANYTLGEADELRRAIGKKIPEIIEENRNKFVRKSVENGIDERVAQEVYRLIDKFGGYGFNKSHSAAYALIVYWTAYFKSNYSKEFFAAVMSTEMYNIERLSLFINEAKEKGIIVHVPDVNKSNYEFTVEEDGIRFGLVAIKGIGINTVNGIIKIRNDETDGKYKSYDDFVHRVKQEGLNKKQLEALIFSGALDLLDGNRREKHHSIDKIMDWSEKKFNSEEDLQLILFGGKVHKAEDFYLEKMDEFKKIVLLNKEKEHLGVYISDHPLNAYKSLIDMIDHTSLNELEQIEKRNQVNKIRLIGIISDINKITTKASMEPMAKFKLEDFTGLIECVCFPRDFVKYGYQIYDDNVVIVEGHINNEKNKKTIITSNISNILDLEENKYLNLYILIDEETKDFTSDLKSLIRDNKGENAVYMAIVNDEKREIIKLSDKYKVNLSKSFIGKLVKLVGTKKIRIK
ncbi:MAG: DNA polymerase III subunit alpha, partial [Leptotrichiaceae bacterium]